MKEKIVAWIKKTGYPLEMKIASILNKKGIPFIQSHYYYDPESNKMREIDFLIRITDDTGFCRVFSSIECKHVTKPWIILNSKKSYIGDLHSYCIFNNYGLEKFVKKLTSNSEEILNWEWFRPKKQKIGYTIIEAFSGGTDKTYDARMSSLKASISMKKDDEKEEKKYLSFFFPAVITDGELFTAEITDSDDINIEKINSGIVFSPFIIDEFQATNIHVVTMSGFEYFIDQLVSESKKLFTLLDKDIKMILREAMEA